MGYRKRILQILLLVSAAAMVYVAAAWGSSPQEWQMRSGRQGLSAGIKEKKRYPSEAEARELSNQLPLVCAPVPYFFYTDAAAALTPAVKAYIEENAALFAGKIFSYDMGNENTIWGDEELTVLAREEEKQIEEALTVYYRDIRGVSRDHYDYDIYYFMKYIVCADYDNDGVGELFFRDEEEKNILLAEENDGYRTQYVNLYGKTEAPAAQMWFVKFDGKTVTFEVSTPYGEAYPILSAYLIEEAQKTPLVTCQLVFGETTDIGKRQFDFNDCPRLSLLPKMQSSGFYENEETGEEVREICANLQIQSGEAESSFPAELLAFIREGERELLSGKSIRQYLEPYVVDTKEDTEVFREREEWNRYFYASSLHWAYRWESGDGSENFLLWEDCELGYSEGMPETARLCRFKADGESGYKREEMLRFSEYDSAFLISYEGQLCCIVVDMSLGVTGSSEIRVVVLGEAGEWEEYDIFLTPQADAYELIALDCTGAPAAVSAYVEAEYDTVLSVCRSGAFYAGLTGDGIPDAVWRDIKNRDAYYNDAGMEWGTECTYRMWDADNDGEAEYLAVYCDYDKYAYKEAYYPRRTTMYVMYGYREGKFAELLLDTVEEDGAFATNYGRSYEWDLGEGCTVRRYPQQLWFEELDGTTYFFTMELLAPTHSFLLRARVIADGSVEEAGAWIVSAPVAENWGESF